MKVFILHGWTYEPGPTWERLFTILRARGIDFEALKIPGLSDGTDPVWTLDDYVEWLRQKTGGQKISLWGHSNGGRICIAFAATYPSDVQKLILEDSAGVPPKGARKLKRDIIKKLSEFFHFFKRSPVLRSLVHTIIRENDYHRASANMKKTMVKLGSVDVRSLLQKVSAPTLIVWGPGDTTTPVSAGLDIHAGIRNSKLVFIPGARHSPHITHPKEVADIVVPFLTS